MATPTQYAITVSLRKNKIGTHQYTTEDLSEAIQNVLDRTEGNLIEGYHQISEKDKRLHYHMIVETNKQFQYKILQQPKVSIKTEKIYKLSGWQTYIKRDLSKYTQGETLLMYDEIRAQRESAVGVVKKSEV